MERLKSHAETEECWHGSLNQERQVARLVIIRSSDEYLPY